jgi:hypothetical protein
MRALLIVACLAVTLSSAAAALCPTVTGDVFKPTTCPAYAQCDLAFCRCAGSSTADVNASTCLRSAASATCASLTQCFAAFAVCQTNLNAAALRTSTDPACSTMATAVHQAVLAVTVGMYPDSLLQSSCRSTVCRSMNSSSLSTCTFGVNDSNVCIFTPPTTAAGQTSAPATLAQTTAGPTSPPVTTSPGTVYLITAIIKFSGTAYGLLLNDPTKRFSLELSVKSDLVAYFNLTGALLDILSMTEGSLIVNFAIKEGASQSVAQLVAAVNNAANSTTLISSLRTLYATVSSETITVSSVSVGATAAPRTTMPPSTTARPTDPIDGASSVSLSAIGVLVAAAMLWITL